MTYRNGYLDGSGKGTITLNEYAVLRTHWGCNCCDSGATLEDELFADKIVKILNNQEAANRGDTTISQKIRETLVTYPPRRKSLKPIGKVGLELLRGERR
jgi:hypothetical protein